MFSSRKSAAPAAAGGYTIAKSLRFRSSASAYLNRTLSSTSNRQKFTISVWTKRGQLGSYQGLIQSACPNPPFGNTFDGLRWSNSDQLEFAARGGNDAYVVPSNVFRDPAAWYHFVIAVDTTQATASNRILFYINGVQVTSFSSASYPSQNYSFNGWNVSGYNNAIGADSGLGSQFFDGYMAEINVIDGSQQAVTSFGANSATTGVWQPIAYTGTYGTNGYYLKFTDTSSTSALGTDYSGNSNTYTVANISLTSGTTYDSMTDVPTLTSATAANYCVINPLNNGGTLSNGNLQFTQGASHALAKSTFAVPTTGLWYAESIVSTLTSGSVAAGFGLGTAALSLTATASTASGAWVLYGSDQTYFNRNSTQTSIVGTFAANDVLQIAIDLANSRAWVGKNNTWYDGSNGTTGNPATGSNPTFTSLSSELFVICNAYSNTVNINFGQRPFAYTPPSGFVALNTFNLPTPTIGATASTQANKYFDATLYTGTGSALSVTNTSGFKPDLVWTKSRNNVTYHGLTDSVRGVSKALFSNATDAESSAANNYVTAFNSNGFSVNQGSASGANGYTYVGWQWQAGQGTTSSNTAGSITSTVSVNTTAGFSIVTYTGNGTTGATVGHGLGVAPNMIIAKCRGAVTSWSVYHSSLGATSWILLNSDSGATTSAQEWNNTAPTSSVFTIGNSSSNSNQSSTYVAYCFAQVAGYSAFGSYTGNGSTDGPFIYTGFRPKYILIKLTSGSGYEWYVYDSVRETYNVAQTPLFPNQDSAESTNTAFNIDILSNGFKCRATYAGNNGNGSTYIYACFAESPFKYANAR